MTVGLVVVSHSRALARAAVALAQEMLHGKQIRIAIAAGLDDTTFGTDATQIVDAITAADQGDGVGGADGPRQRGAVGRTGARNCSTTMSAPGGAVSRTPGGGAGGGRGGRRRAAPVSTRWSAEAAGALAGKVGHLGPGRRRPSRRRAADADELTGEFHRHQPPRPARPARRPAGAGGAPPRRPSASSAIARTESEWVDAGQPFEDRHARCAAGDEVEVRVSGGQAAETLEHVLALAARNFDEASEPGRSRSAQWPPNRRARHPIGASPGLGIGPARSARLGPHRGARRARRGPRPPSGAEWARRSRRCAAPSANCAPAPPVRSVRPRRRSSTRTSCCSTTPNCSTTYEPVSTAALRAVGLVGGGHGDLAAEFAALPDPYLQARAADVARSATRCCGPCSASATAGRGIQTGVLIADDLTPAEAAELDSRAGGRGVAGVRQPACAQRDPVAGEGNSRESSGRARRCWTSRREPSSRWTALDGEFIVDPPTDVQQHVPRPSGQRWRGGSPRPAPAPTSPPSPLTDSRSASARTSAPMDDARAAAAHGADFAGLVRTEFLFLGRSDSARRRRAGGGVPQDRRVPRRAPRHAAHAGCGRGQAAGVPTDARRGRTRSWGCAGIRLSLSHPGSAEPSSCWPWRWWRTHTPVSVMFPMISTLDELFAARCTSGRGDRPAGRGRPADLQVGMMVEVPAAALKAAAFARARRLLVASAPTT